MGSRLANPQVCARKRVGIAETADRDHLAGPLTKAFERRELASGAFPVGTRPEIDRSGRERVDECHERSAAG